ncbi:MAG: hypothetical protein H6828_09725 [Planctomycetes bacterium]|nr:hypothetical protein [Planctomycetota bacterium]
MRRLLPTLLVGLALAWPLAPHGPAAPEGALLTRIELERGRALFVDDTGVVPLERHAGPRSHTGPGHFELAPGSTAVVRWAGRGSVRVEGPTSLSWDELTAEDELRLRFGTVAEADLELRRGGARVDLPGAWRLELGPGAVNLRSLPVGGVEFVHHAGVAARASWIGGPGVSAPRWIGPGSAHASRARLSPAARPT